MCEVFVPERGWGPDGRRAALSITFDNFGEAAEIEMGWWGDKPVGAHYTAAFVPRLIEVLGEVRATYFVEASNAAIYPGPLAQWRKAGHEIGLHAWRHETWAKCSADRRQDILARSLTAMRAIGVWPAGFRPPGGAIPAETWAEFEAAGLLYCSPVGAPGVSRVGDMISLPFAWPDVDAFQIEEILGFVRVEQGWPEAPVDLSQWRAGLQASLDAAVAAGSQRTVIFHPQFLAQSDDKLAALDWLIDAARAADIWIAPAGDVADFAAAQLGLGHN